MSERFLLLLAGGLNKTLIWNLVLPPNASRWRLVAWCFGLLLYARAFWYKQHLNDMSRLNIFPRSIHRCCSSIVVLHMILQNTWINKYTIHDAWQWKSYRNLKHMKLLNTAFGHNIGKTLNVQTLINTQGSFYELGWSPCYILRNCYGMNHST